MKARYCRAVVRASLGFALTGIILGCGKTPRSQQEAPAHLGTTSSGVPWVKLLGDLNPQSVNAVATDADGDVFAGGHACGRRVATKYQNGSIDFGDGARETVGECELFVAKYSRNGSLAWAHTEGEEGWSTKANALAVLPSKHVIVGGHRGRDMLLEELGADGKLVASHRYSDFTGGDGSADVRGLALTTDGDWLVAGESFKRIDLGSGHLEHVGTVPFVARYAPDGKPRWVAFASVASMYKASASSVALDAAGNAYACGETDGAHGDSGSGFVQSFDGKTGAVRWTRLGGGSCDAISVLDKMVVVDGAATDGGAALVAFSLEGDKRWTVPMTADGFHVSALAPDKDSVLAVGGVLHDRMRLLRVDAAGGVRASKDYSTTLQVRSIASASGVVILGGQLDGSADLGAAGKVQTKAAAPEETTNYDGLMARLISPW